MRDDPLRDPWALGVFVLTLLLPVVVGILAMRRTRSESDFYVGGRSMNRYVVALSAVSTGRSSWLVLGVSGMAYQFGVGAVWAVVGYILVELLQFVYVGRRLRRESEAYGSITLLDYLESRLGDRSHVVRLVGALIIAVFLSAYVAAQLNAGAASLGTALDLAPAPSLGIAALLIVVYMVLGGYVAVAYNDVLRAILMLVGLVVVPVWGAIRFGGIGLILDTLAQLDPRLVDPTALGAGVVIGFLGIGLGSPGQPHVVVRYMSIDDPARLRFSAVVGTVWNVVLAWGAVFIGLLGRAMIHQAAALPDGNPEMVYLELSDRLFDPAIYGLLVGGVFAAILSTADSQLLVLASTFTRDVYGKVIRGGREPDERTALRLGRLVVVLCGAAALVLAWAAEDLVFWLVLFAWGGLGAAFGPALILSLHWKRVHRWGVLAGMITGATTAIVWKLWLKKPTGLYELIPAFVLATLAVVVVSLLCPRSSAPATG